MEPRIQYAKTEDGVNIAYWTMGKGEALFCTPPWSFTHIGLELKDRLLRAWYEQLSEANTLVRFDFRAAGLSDREVAKISFDARVEDIRAVVDQLGLKQFALMGIRGGGLETITYATRFPERVSHLILWDCFARARDSFIERQREILEPMIERDWEAYTETYTHQTFGWSQGRRANQFAKFIRESIAPGPLRAHLEAIRDVDVTALLPEVACPTLILSDGAYPTPEASRELASGIPGASLALATLVSDRDGWPDIATAVREFMSNGESTAKSARITLAGTGTAIILFLDIAGSTELTSKLGDAAYRERERELDTSLRAAITETGGTPVEGKVLGDGIMSVFTSARQAIDAAVRCRDLGNKGDLPLCLGIHAGDVVREGNNVHGGAVQVAARVVDAAEPGEILVSDIVRGLARTSAGVAFEDRGEHELKGIPEPQRLFAVQE